MEPLPALWSNLIACAAVGYRRRLAPVGRLAIGRSLPSWPTTPACLPAQTCGNMRQEVTL
jgi:hypothetical protein